MHLQTAEHARHASRTQHRRCRATRPSTWRVKRVCSRIGPQRMRRHLPDCAVPCVGSAGRWRSTDGHHCPSSPVIVAAVLHVLGQVGAPSPFLSKRLGASSPSSMSGHQSTGTPRSWIMGYPPAITRRLRLLVVPRYRRTAFRAKSACVACEVVAARLAVASRNASTIPPEKESRWDGSNEEWNPKRQQQMFLRKGTWRVIGNCPTVGGDGRQREPKLLSRLNRACSLELAYRVEKVQLIGEHFG